MLNAGNVADPRIVLVNPAALAIYQRPVVVSVYNRFYAGLPNGTLSSGSLGAALPLGAKWSAGLSGNYFNADLADYRNLAANFAVNFWEKKLAAGVRLGYFGVAYDQDKFYRFDKGDPLFARRESRHQFDLGVGLLANPAENFFAGLVLEHLNRPNLSLANDAKGKAPFSAGLGAMYRFAFARPLLALEYEAGKLYFSAGAEKFFGNETAMLRSLVSRERLGFGAAVLLGGLRLDYDFQWPLTEMNELTNGFHHLTVSYHFKSESSRRRPDFFIKTAPLAETRREANPCDTLEFAVASALDSVPVTATHEIIEETPLLNCLFFAEGKSEIPAERYHLQPSPSLRDDQAVSVHEQYRHVLNLVARRLRNHREWRIVVVGCNSNEGLELNNAALSRQRALAVKRHLVEACGVDSAQIAIAVRDLPEHPSTTKDRFGHEENRRAEIVPLPGAEELLAPLVRKEQVVSLADSACTFMLDGASDHIEARRWELTITNETAQILRRFSGNAAPPKTLWWDWRDDSGARVPFGETFNYSLEVEDKCGKPVASPWKKLPVRRRERERRVTDRTQLVLFQFDSDSIAVNAPAVRRKLNRIVEKFRANPGAKISIKGYTDVIGAVPRNRLLSTSRAKQIHAALTALGVPPAAMSYAGLGAGQPMMSNALPEGRMMNRRVEIDLVFPAKPKR
jgi:outer membrane protein OmpA-like peptidoglycan-associated protein